jgi:hypothetical protein
MRRFPLLRRLTALLTHLLLLQLAFASAAGACPLGERGAGHGDMQMSGASSPGSQQHPADAAPTSAHPPVSPTSHQEGGTHCDMSCTTASCAAAGHCMTNAVLVRTDADHALGCEHSGASVRGDTAPHSVSTAPEPPPPRA